MTAEVVGCPFAALTRDGDRWAGSLDDHGVAVVRDGGRLHAFADTCPHGAVSLADAPVRGGVVTCPGHGARFRLSDGKALSGPSRVPLPCFDVEDGVLRRRERRRRRSLRQLLAALGGSDCALSTLAGGLFGFRRT